MNKDIILRIMVVLIAGNSASLCFSLLLENEINVLHLGVIVVNCLIIYKYMSTEFKNLLFEVKERLNITNNK
ncbi:hypothetical protein M2277_005022 [Paenibacillus sp. LBL]|nr:hypothetical protein [Paenibacillus sp. LBL]